MNKVKRGLRSTNNMSLDDERMHRQKLQSFKSLSDDNETMPVPQDVIERASVVLSRIYSRDHRLPFFTIPTRSGGVGLEYRGKVQDRKWIIYYRFNHDGTMTYSRKWNSRTDIKEEFTDLAAIPTVEELLAR